MAMPSRVMDPSSLRTMGRWDGIDEYFGLCGPIPRGVSEQHRAAREKPMSDQGEIQMPPDPSEKRRSCADGDGVDQDLQCIDQSLGG